MIQLLASINQRLLLCCVFGIIWCGVPAKAKAQTPTHKDIHIATAGKYKLLLDLYLPTKKNPPPPLLIYIHGGAWLSGDKSEFKNYPLNKEWLKKGYAGASISYRLTSYPDHPTFPSQIWDVKVAVRFLREHAALYGYDPKRFAVFGTSAGGYLASLLGTSCGVTQLKGGNLYGTVNSCVQAVVTLFGPTDLLNMDLHVTTPPGSDIAHDAPNSPESLLIGWNKGIGDLRRNFNNPNAPYPSYKNLMILSNPMTHIRNNAPPFFIAHGKKDRLVPLKQSTVLANALKAKGIYVEYKEVAGYGHSDLGTAVELDALRFIEKQFFKAPPKPEPRPEPPPQPEPRSEPPPRPEPPRPEPTNRPEPPRPEPKAELPSLPFDASTPDNNAPQPKDNNTPQPVDRWSPQPDTGTSTPDPNATDKTPSEDNVGPGRRGGCSCHTNPGGTPWFLLLLLSLAFITQRHETNE